MSDPSSDVAQPPDAQATRWFRFSLKTLLVVTALVAVYFAGRASTRPNWNAPDPGTWQMNIPSGYQAPIALVKLPDGSYLLDHGTGSNLGGEYEWKAGQLQVVVPNDSRYVGLTWQWDGDDLVLVAEPAGRPSGATYLGTRLRFVTPDISPEARKQVPVVPSRFSRQAAVPRGVARLQQRQPSFQPTEWRDPEPGEWQLTLPAGFKHKATLKKLSGRSFEFSSGGVFDGTYEVRNGQLEVVKPDDKRMIGLAWARVDEELVLVNEPSPPPTGAQYLGARLRRVKGNDK